MEDTFLQFEEEVISHSKFQYFHYAVDVILQVGACSYGYIIHVFSDLGSQWFPFVDDGPEDPVHHCLEGGRGITETKEHHRWFP